MLSVLFCFLVFVFVFIYLVSLLLFHEKNNIKLLKFKVCLSSILSVFGVFCLLFSFKSLFVNFVFPVFKTPFRFFVFGPAFLFFFSLSLYL